MGLMIDYGATRSNARYSVANVQYREEHREAASISTGWNGIGRRPL
jgi:hypothetical protein